MTIQEMILMLSSKFGITWESHYYSLLEKGYSHEEAVCYTYNKYFTK